MQLFHFVTSRLHDDAESVNLAEEIAERCFERAWNRVSEQVVWMSPAETRGFVRARTADVLRDAVRRQTEPRNFDRVYSRVMNAVLRRVAEHAYTIRVEGARQAA